MEIFWSGMRIFGALLQIAGVIAIVICGLALIASAAWFVIGGVLKFWFDADKEDGQSGAERCWNRIWNGQGWSKEGEMMDEGEDIYFSPRETSPNLCICRSCPECDTMKAEKCPARKCENCSGDATP